MVIETKDDLCIRIGTTKSETLKTSSETEEHQLQTASNPVQDKDNVEVCRVCFGTEPDKRGEAALEFLKIFPPVKAKPEISCCSVNPSFRDADAGNTQDVGSPNQKREEVNRYVEYRSPDGEVFVCVDDLGAGIEAGYHDALIELGCLCKNDLSLGHYSCALRWFISHGSVVCEICGHVAENVKLADMNKVMAALKECEALRAMTAAGEATPAHGQRSSTVDPDAFAAVRRQRLTEIASWFNPRYHTPFSQAPIDEVSGAPVEEPVTNIHPATKWVVEGTGILVATGLLTVTLAWLIAPRVGKKTARSGLHILLGGLCALTAVIFLRFAVLPRIKYGRARYWAIVFVFMFLVFGIWASRTRNSESH